MGSGGYCAKEVEDTDPMAAATLRRFSEELWNVRDRYKAILPTNKDLNPLRARIRQSRKPSKSDRVTDLMQCLMMARGHADLFAEKWPDEAVAVVKS
jgi:hypothetical protein